jgi:nicotinate phosphoribosyltransferase
VLGARAAYIGGAVGTSNTMAGFRFGIPVMGTCAHSWVMAFATEREAFRSLQKALGPHTIQLVDTYDPIEGTRRAAELGRPLWGIRLDSGDFGAQSKSARAILDAAGLQDAKIMASGELDEWKIAELVASGAPIDAFGVGTPSMGTIYKLVELEGRFTAKRSEDKTSLPGSKQLFRFPDRDVLGLAAESCPAGAEALLRPVILKGQLVDEGPGLEGIRQYAAESARKVTPRPLEYSEALTALVGRLRMERK